MQLSKILPWFLSAVGVAGLLIAVPLAILVPVGVLLGGMSAGMAFLILSLTIGPDAASKFDPGLYWMPALISSVLALVGTIRRATVMFQTAKFPSFVSAMTEAFKHLMTLHLAFQIGLGSTFAVGAVLLTQGDPTMSGPNALVVSLFSVFVFIVATTFTSYFLRSLIPWRKEHPRFSNAVAYTLSTLLGLIAATYAFAAKETFDDATRVGATLYQASVLFATIGATLVGAYVAIQEKRQEFSNQNAVSGDGRNTS